MLTMKFAPENAKDRRVFHDLNNGYKVILHQDKDYIYFNIADDNPDPDLGQEVLTKISRKEWLRFVYLLRHYPVSQRKESKNASNHEYATKDPNNRAFSIKEDQKTP
jgi:hypothetical protein